MLLAHASICDEFYVTTAPLKEKKIETSIFESTNLWYFNLILTVEGLPPTWGPDPPF